MQNGKRRALGFFLFGSLIVLIVSIMLTIVYIGMDRGKRSQAYKMSALLIEHVQNVLANNESKEQSLVESLKESYISKAKAVSYMIDNVPRLEWDIAELIRIAKLMGIDEIHLFDSDGVIYWGTVPSYYGYDFNSGDQMAFFKPMLSNKSLSMCQNVTPNTAEGKPMMYAICWSDTGKRMNQIGVEPRRLLEEMRSNEISEVIGNLPTYDGVNIMVADSTTGNVEGSSLPRNVGKYLRNLGLDTEYADKYKIHEFRTFVDGQDSYCSILKNDENVIVIVQERAVVNQDIHFTMIIVAIYLLIAVSAIGCIVTFMTRRVIKEHSNANVDVMTGLFNRRAYENDIKKLDESSIPEDLVYISIDINGLKEVNDNFGHEAGDELINGAARCMKQCFGESGTLYRIGGDEFVALVRADSEKLNEMILNYKTLTTKWTEKHGRNLSTACGVAKHKDDPSLSMIELANLADKNMYEAKAGYYRVTGHDRRKR